uniref:Ovule protein n=1 Tax=Schistosoma curassoni TaxID=6186 RepID=A0A183JVL7_9TREM
MIQFFITYDDWLTFYRHRCTHIGVMLITDIIVTIIIIIVINIHLKIHVLVIVVTITNDSDMRCFSCSTNNST